MEWGEILMNDLQRLAQWMRDAKSVVVLTGAGMSTESGLPDFRSKGGWWRGIDPTTVATLDAFYDDYELFQAFYKMRIEALSQVRPHEGHVALAMLQQTGFIQTIATQNVDNLHTVAGATDVLELHGNLREIRCQSCDKANTVQAFTTKQLCHCGGKLRPGVVLFGEMLPERAWQGALAAIEQADVVLVIGTSLQVSPVNQLPRLTRGKKVFINLQASSNELFDLVIEGSAKQTLVSLQNELLTI